MQKMFSLLVVVFSLLALAAPVFAQEATEEPVMVVPVMRSGDVFEGALEGTTSGQLYVFTGTAGDEVTVTVTSADDALLFLPAVVLLGSRGQVYGQDDSTDENDDLNVASLKYTLPANDSYFVFVTSTLYLNVFETADATFEDAQNYTVTLDGATEPTDLPNDLPIYVAEVGIGESGTLTVTEAEPVYYVQFVGEAGQVIDIVTDTSADTSVDTLLYLFDPEGRRVAMSDDADGLEAQILAYELPLSGEYTVFATSAFYYQAADDATMPDYGSFEISIRESAS